MMTSMSTPSGSADARPSRGAADITLGQAPRTRRVEPKVRTNKEEAALCRPLHSPCLSPELQRSRLASPRSSKQATVHHSTSNKACILHLMHLPSRSNDRQEEAILRLHRTFILCSKLDSPCNKEDSRHSSQDSPWPMLRHHHCRTATTDFTISRRRQAMDRLSLHSKAASSTGARKIRVRISVVEAENHWRTNLILEIDILMSLASPDDRNIVEA